MKCTCGYEMRLPGEEEMFEQWGCARTVVRKGGMGYGNTVVMCSNGQAPKDVMPAEDSQEFVDAFKKKYEKDGKTK